MTGNYSKAALYSFGLVDAEYLYLIYVFRALFLEGPLNHNGLVVSKRSLLGLHFLAQATSSNSNSDELVSFAVHNCAKA